METVFLALFSGIAAFIATNIDDLFLLIMFFSDRSFRAKHVVFGQYAGILALVAVSSIGYFASFAIPRGLLPLMGLLPIAVGLGKLVRPGRAGRPAAGVSRHAKTLSVAAVCFASGGDNIIVYMPLFANASLLQMMVYLMVFAIMAGAWCVLGYKMARNRIAGAGLRKCGRAVLPFALVALGIWILLGGM